jgi:hypothetical protein
MFNFMAQRNFGLGKNLGQGWWEKKRGSMRWGAFYDKNFRIFSRVVYSDRPPQRNAQQDI